MGATEDHKKKHHPKKELFTYSCDAGTVSLPYVENVPRKLARHVAEAARKGEDADDVLFGQLLDADGMAVLEEMTLGEYDEFTTRWNEESAIQLGGIVALLDVLEEHSSAIEYDLLTMGGGYRLRWLDDPQAHDFNWRDLRVAIEHAPRSSALTLAVDGSEAVEWDLTRQLLASMADTLNLLWWAKTEDGAANRNPPEPIERPGVQSSKKHYGSDPLPEDEMIEWLGPRFAHLKSDQ